MLTCGFSLCYFRGAVRVMQEMRSDSQFPDAVFSFILFVFFTDKTTIPNRKTHCCTRVPRIFIFIFSFFFTHAPTHTHRYRTTRCCTRVPRLQTVIGECVCVYVDVWMCECFRACVSTSLSAGVESK